MSATNGSAAPASGTFDGDIPSFDELAADPEIAALLDFEPVPRKIIVAGGWDADRQREFIARLALHGSPGPTCDEMDMHRTGVTKLYKSPFGESFRKSWDGAVALATRRKTEQARLRRAPLKGGTVPPSFDHRRKHPSTNSGQAGEGGLPGQVMNEAGEWEDEDSYVRRAEEAKDSIASKLQRSRRLFLQDISDCPAKRAAFEILAEFPVDWELAAQCMPQADEPWRRPSMRQPDMLLTAEAGWLGGEFVYGPDRKAELLAEVNEWRAEQGLVPVGWKDEE